MQTLTNESDTIVSNEVVEKIRKLLALGSSQNQHESERALMKARELALRHEIDLATIDPFAGEKRVEEKYEQTQVPTGKRRSICQRYISWIIANHFKCKVLYGGGRWHGTHLVFVGRTSDIKMAEYVQSYLTETFFRCWNEYKKATGATLSERNSFFHGFYNGLDAKLSKEALTVKAHVLSEIEIAKGQGAAESVNQSHALMVVTDKEKLDEAVHTFFPKLGTYRGGRGGGGSHSSSAMAAGRVAGGSCNINRPIGAGSSNHLN